MASREQNSYEGIFSSYRINLRLIQTKLTIVAEHRQTKKVYRTEIDQNVISQMTQSICETSEQLFELLQELIDNDGKNTNKDLKIIEEGAKLIVNVTLIVAFGRTSREFLMQFELENVQLDDITRLENIINEYAQRLEELEWSMNDRFARATKLGSLYDNEFQFRSLSPTDQVNLSDNARTISWKIQPTSSGTHTNTSQTMGYSFGSASMTPTIISQDAVVITNQPFLFSTNKRYQLVRFNLHSFDCFGDKKILIGVVYQPNNEEWSKIIPSPDAWLLDVSRGYIQHAYFGDHPYTWPLATFLQQSVQQRNPAAHVDLLLDVHHRCVAFRVQDQTEDRWAFYLPKHVQINQLYPCIVLNKTSIAVSID